ncbi:hypothetical protein Tco_0376011, partial [Tanacetum coccineum]
MLTRRRCSSQSPMLVPREVLKGLNIEEGESSRPWEIYVLGWGIPRRSWFTLARGAMAQTDILEIFENLQE